MQPSESLGEEKIHYITCPLCEATCGLEVHTAGREVVSIRGDVEDPFSKGYLCPKGYSLKELDADTDRLRQPMIRTGDKWREVTWDEAFAEIEKHLRNLIDTHGADAVGVYLGNPNVHTLAGQLYVPNFLRALGSKNRFSASTVDQMPKQVSAGLMFGTGFSIPIPDVDRTDYFLVIGANPMVSNGSLMTGPNMRDRLRQLRQRGGKLVVVDPVRTRTAKEADEHYFIRPGMDAFFLMALVHTLFEENLVSFGHLQPHLRGLEEIQVASADFAPEQVASLCGISAADIRKIAREISNAPTAAVYGRMGTCTQRFGTVNGWLIDVINILTGNLDNPGGVMFPKAAAGGRNTTGQPGHGRGLKLGRFKSRVRGLPEVLGELPVACMIEEMEEPGAGQIRAIVTIGGNPVLSTPNGNRLDAALSKLDFMVSVDCYLNETTRHAHVLLPVPSHLQRSHYDISFYQLAVRNIAHYSDPVFDLDAGQLAEWEIILRLTAAVSTQQLGEHPIGILDDFLMQQMIQQEITSESSPLSGRDSEEILRALGSQRGPRRMLDFLLRMGPYGDCFGGNPDGLSLDKLKMYPHGLDLGPLQPRIPEVLRTASGKIEVAPSELLKDVERMRGDLSCKTDSIVLVGRRDLRSNNSWMHNLSALMKGGARCELLIHPEDATLLGVANHSAALVVTETGKIEVGIEYTEDIMPGVVSLPHGWGHNQSHTKLQIANQHPGINVNRLTNVVETEAITGNAILNGVAVRIEALD